MKNSIKIILVLLLLVLIWQSHAIDGGDNQPIPPDQAFISKVSIKNPNTLIASWTISEGTYLYRDKIKISSLDPATTLGQYSLPPGKLKKDPLFGEVKIFRNQLSVEIPIKSINKNNPTLSIQTQWQGCADIGICYPPQKKNHTLNLVAAATQDIQGTQTNNTATDKTLTNSLNNAAKNDPAVNNIKQLGNNLGLNDNQDEILPSEKAFVMSAALIDEQFQVNWNIAEGYYLYRNKLKLSVKSGDIKLGTITIPAGKLKKDPLFGNVEVFYHNAKLTAQIQNQLSDKTVELEVIYQGCAEAGLCYPPVKQIVSLNKQGVIATKISNSYMDVAQATASNNTNNTATTTSSNSSITSTDAKQACDQGEISELGKLEQILKQGNYWIIITVFILTGLGLAFTPCVFPMVPILMSIIAGQGNNITTKKGFSLSLVYVLSMALVYTSIGILAGMLGKNINASLNEPLPILIFVGIFVLLALAMFGVFNFQLPASMQNKLAEFSNKQKGGTYIGVIIMGFLAALVAGPCVAAPMAAVLIFIAQEGNATLGGSALFALSIGMGLPLIVLGTGGGKYLPKAGAWMDRIKMFFGIAMLALAIYMLDRLSEQLMPDHVIIILSGVLALFSAIMMGLFSPLKENAGIGAKVWKLLSLLVLSLGITWVVGGAGKGQSLLAPFSHVNVTHQTFKRIKTLEDLAREVNLAKAQNKTVMLDFYADWCIECTRMEKTTFSNPEVQQLLANTVLLQADVTKDDKEDQRLRNYFKIPGPPAILFFNKNGEELSRYRFFGYMEPQPFANLLKRTLCN